MAITNLQRQPIPGQPSDATLDDAMRRIQLAVLALQQNLANPTTSYPFGIPRLTPASYSVQKSDRCIWITGSTLTITLPPAASVPLGWSVYVRNNNVTVDTATVSVSASPDNIDGAGSVSLLNAGSGNVNVGAFFTSDGVSRYAASFTGG